MFSLGSDMTNYFVDYRVKKSGDGLTFETAFKTEKEAWDIIDRNAQQYTAIFLLKKEKTMNSTTEIARIAHETNRIYCQTLGDYSQEPWDFCPQWQRDSARNGVQAIQRGVVTRPEQSHENWMKEKYDKGWIYGEKKNTDLDIGTLTHPCMVPFKELTVEQQIKDRLFFAIVTTLLGQ